MSAPTWDQINRANRLRQEQIRIRHDFLLALQDVYGTAESIEAEALLDQLDRRGLKVVVA